MTHRSAGHHIFCRRWLDFLLDNSLLRTGENWTSPPADVRVSGCANTSSWVLRHSPTVFWDTTSYRARAAPLTHRRATPQCGRTGDTLGLPHAPAPHARRSKTLSCMCSDTLGELVGRRTLTSTQSSRSLEVQVRWPPLGAVSDDCIVAVMGVRLEARCAHGVR